MKYIKLDTNKILIDHYYTIFNNINYKLFFKLIFILLIQKSPSNNGVIVSWSTSDLKPSSFQNYILNLPLFNSECKQLNEIRIELNTYNLVQIILGLFLFITIIGGVIFYCISLDTQNSKKELLDSNSNLGANSSANLSFNHSFISNE